MTRVSARVAAKRPWRVRAAWLLGAALLSLPGPALCVALPDEASTVGPVTDGSARIRLSVDQFDVVTSGTPAGIEARLVPHTIRWSRVYGSLLMPRAVLEISLPADAAAATARYRDTTHVFQRDGDRLRARLYVFLLDAAPVELFDGGRETGHLTLRARPPSPDEVRLQVDWSCVPFGLAVRGLEDQFVSVGCRLTKTYYGSGEGPQLEVSWLASNSRLRDGLSPPYIAQLRGDGPLLAQLEGDDGSVREIGMTAAVPERRHRLRLAYGLGPYSFDAKQGEDAMGSRLSPSLMLYGNLGINSKESLRFFEALVFNDAVFSNFGGYYAYVAGRRLDSRLTIVTLLGAQELSFKYRDSSKWSHDIFFPQGFEIVYSHAFGWENYHLMYGMFLSPISDMDYKNIWLRFGRTWFWEINYIEWEYRNRSARMWGLSLGLPLAQLF